MVTSQLILCRGSGHFTRAGFPLSPALLTAGCCALPLNVFIYLVMAHTFAVADLGKQPRP